MKKITLFYLENCPYCIHAKKALAELRAERPAYGDVEIEWIEESRHPELVAGYDYYYVPSMFAGGTKLYEANPGQDYNAVKASIRKALDTVFE